MKNTHSDWKQAAVSLLGKIQDVFKNDCCIPCYQCHKLQNEIEALLSCVQPGRDGRTQTSLRPAGETKAAKCSVWHSSKDVPDGYNRYVIAVTVNDTWVKMSVCDLTAFLSGMHAPMIQKWAYIDELEAL